MGIEEYDVSFLIKRPNSPPRLIVTYLCLSEVHFRRFPKLSRMELIAQNSIFLLKDRYMLEEKTDIQIKLLKIRRVHKVVRGQREIIKHGSTYPKTATRKNEL